MNLTVTCASLALLLAIAAISGCSSSARVDTSQSCCPNHYDTGMIPDKLKQQTGAEEAVRSEISRADTTGDGVVDVLFGRVFSTNGQLICSWSVDFQRKLMARSFYVDGREVLSQGDSNGDGLVDTIIMFDMEGVPNTVLKTSGLLLSLASEEELESIRNTYQVNRAIVEPVLKEIRSESHELGKTRKTGIGHELSSGMGNGTAAGSD